MGDPAGKRATRADLDALPETVAGELIHGVLYTRTRPRARHQNAGSVLGADLNGAYQRGRGGPGGWWILDEPGIRIAELDVEEISPDIGGWKRARLPDLPDDRPIEIAPDWVCEILSPTTRAHDLKLKRPLYARMGVTWMWVVDLAAKTLVSSRSVEGKWLELATYSDDDVSRVEPFDALEIRLADVWG